MAALFRMEGTVSFKNLSRRNFVGTLAAAAGSTLLPSSALGKVLQDPVINQSRGDGYRGIAGARVHTRA